MRKVMPKEVAKLGTVEEVPGLWGVVSAPSRSDFVERHRVFECRNIVKVYRHSMI